MFKFIKNMFASKPLPDKMSFVPEEKEYVHTGDGMIEEDLKPKETKQQRQMRLIQEAQANREKMNTLVFPQTRRPNSTGFVPTATHYDNRYIDNTPAYVVPSHSGPSYSSPSYSSSSDSYSSCDSSSSFSGSCD